MRTLIILNQLNQKQKISLLKIKLDFIINGEYEEKTWFLIMAILGSVIIFTISGLDSITLILEALYRVFQEKKIRKALYNAYI